MIYNIKLGCVRVTPTAVVMWQMVGSMSLFDSVKNHVTNEDLISMILSKNCDMCGEKGAMLSVGKFSSVSDQILHELTPRLFKVVIDYIERLELDSFEHWDDRSISGYKTATVSIKEFIKEL